MRNEDNDCIRYLMKEMDPSEELLMERAMMEDENLLIEVESMRQTLKKLDKLPRKDPPSELSNNILKQAAEQAEKNRESQKTLNPVFKYAVAATLALTIGAGGTWFYMGGSVTDDSRRSRISAAPSQSQVASGSSDFQLNNINFEALKVTSAAAKKVTPWVDRENVIHFEDQMNNSDFEALIQESTQKLKPINNSALNNRPVKSIQLTGTGN
ncbi:hypothetical protein [Fodinibius salsisoli]|uniref:Anti-sigma factor n=1 Tax=Fodinibius salsisoli TaxID=2820877 RepID=A0ABT3PKJ7_9BACT|nr:hypothetical protein [Fodinibius salsisoli]MCW9706422.1 hypothetical protein [Fodinibius salsisoli]